MTRVSTFLSKGILVLALSLGVVAPSFAAEELNTRQIEKLTGLTGKLNETEGVFKVSLLRSDLTVDANGVKITPPLGLTAWAAFHKVGTKDMVMGDIVLTENQVNAVMSAALENGLEVTGLHNHFFWDNPKIMFMHIGGMGAENEIASAVGKVFAKLKETEKAKAPEKVVIDPAKSNLDSKKIDAVFGKAGQLNNGAYKVTIGRKTSMHGHEVGNEMGVNTWAAFAGTDGRAVVDGDFAMFESELQPVLKALRSSGINVVAIHNHMTMENPRIMFLHFWGVGSTVELAKGIKRALDTQK